MTNKLVLLRRDNVILAVLGQFRNKWLAKNFISDNYPEFRPDGYGHQWHQSEDLEEHPHFITIE